MNYQAIYSFKSYRTICNLSRNLGNDQVFHSFCSLQWHSDNSKPRNDLRCLVTREEKETAEDDFTDPIQKTNKKSEKGDNVNALSQS